MQPAREIETRYVEAVVIHADPRIGQSRGLDDQVDWHVDNKWAYRRIVRRRCNDGNIDARDLELGHVDAAPDQRPDFDAGGHNVDGRLQRVVAPVDGLELQATQDRALDLADFELGRQHRRNAREDPARTAAGCEQPENHQANSQDERSEGGCSPLPDAPTHRSGPSRMCRRTLRSDLLSGCAR